MSLNFESQSPRSNNWICGIKTVAASKQPRNPKFTLNLNGNFQNIAIPHVQYTVFIEKLEFPSPPP